MITISKIQTCGWGPAIRGMRNPKNSWDRSDSEYDKTLYWDDECELEAEFVPVSLGPHDLDLTTTLAKGGPVHAKYRRMIKVYCDITAPLYWWKEFDTYKVGVNCNSCSTMHTLHKRDLTLDDFAHDHLTSCNINLLKLVIKNINDVRRAFVDHGLKEDWYQMIQLLPTSFLQKRTVELNYEVLTNIYHSRNNHKLDEWRFFCEWIKTLPYAEYLIIDPYKLEYDEAHNPVSS